MCHHTWPCCPECKFNLVRKYFYCWFFWCCCCVFGVLLTEGALVPVGCCDEPGDALDLPWWLLSLLLEYFGGTLQFRRAYDFLDDHFWTSNEWKCDGITPDGITSLTWRCCMTCKIFYVLCHRSPPEGSSDVLRSFKLAEMSDYWMCMINDDCDQSLSFHEGLMGYT